MKNDNRLMKRTETLQFVKHSQRYNYHMYDVVVCLKCLDCFIKFFTDVLCSEK